MGFKDQSVLTATFTNTTFAITSSMNLSIVSINLVSGAATILGTMSVPGVSASAAALTVGQPILLQADAGYTLDGITIDSTAGGVFEVIAK
jgi:NADPH-dependent curcumin reductase CurA